MNATISRLFSNLMAPEVVQQAEALAQLSHCLDQAQHPDREAESFYPELDRLEISAEEIDEIVQTAIDFLDRTEVDWSTRISLFLIITENAGTVYTGPLFRFFAKEAERLSEQQAFSSVAQITHFVMRASKKDLPVVHQALTDYGVLEKLREYEKHSSMRLRQSAASTVDYFRKLRLP